MKGRLFVFSGPSGVGKGTVLKKALASLDNIAYSVSCTTRQPRCEDVEGKTYYFMNERDFMSMADEGLFLEWARVHGNCYGTRQDIVEKCLEKGLDVVLEIDVQGALQIKKKMPEAITVFVRPPSLEELEKRLRGRHTETPEQIEVRIANSKMEMDSIRFYDHIITNNTVQQAVSDFIKIVRKYREEIQ